MSTGTARTELDQTVFPVTRSKSRAAPESVTAAIRLPLPMISQPLWDPPFSARSQVPSAFLPLKTSPDQVVLPDNALRTTVQGRSGEGGL